MPHVTQPRPSSDTDGSGLVTRLAVFEGPNPYLPRAAILASLDIARFAGGRPRALQPGQLSLLADILLAHCRASASLDLEPASRDYLRSPRPQPIASTVALLCLELQRLNTTFAEGMRIIGSGKGKHASAIAFGFEQIAMGKAVAAAACDLVDVMFTLEDESKTFEAPASLMRFLTIANAAPIKRGARGILRSARARGIPWLQVVEGVDLLQLGHGCRRKLIHGTKSQLTGQIGHWLTGDKLLCAAFLTRLGFPVPRQIAVSDCEGAIAAARRIGYPVVVKPQAGFNGRGITVGISQDEELAAAFELAASLRRGVLVETFIPGDAHRLVVVDGQLASASVFLPARVIGDGRSDVASLVARENARPVRSQGVASGLLPIVLDAVSDGVLASQGLTRRSVPEAGETVHIRRTANLSTGGTRNDVTAIIHPDNRRMAEQIARTAAIDIAGVDFITPDITRSFRDVPCGINEVNTNPGLGYGDPDVGFPDETVRIVDFLFPPGTPATIPVVHIHGGRQADAIAAALLARAAASGLAIGCASGRGLEVDGLVLNSQPQIGDAAAGRALLCNPAVACAIMTIPLETVRKRGIGTDRADISVLTRASLACASLVRDITSGPVIVPADLVASLPDSLRHDSERLIAVGDGDSPLPRRVWRDQNDGSILTAQGILEPGPPVFHDVAELYAAAASWALEAMLQPDISASPA